MPAPDILGFDNVDILCTDMDEMYRFYHETLGLPLLFPRAEGEDWFAVQAGAVSLYFFPGSGAHPTPFAGDSDLNPPGIESMTFAVADLDQAISDLGGQIQWISDIESWEHPSGTWYRFRFFHDPEGNKLSITEPHKAS